MLSLEFLFPEYFSTYFSENLMKDVQVMQGKELKFPNHIYCRSLSYRENLEVRQHLPSPPPTPRRSGACVKRKRKTAKRSHI